MRLQSTRNLETVVLFIAPIQTVHLFCTVQVEDIMDTGLTLTKIVESLTSAGPKSVRICTLLDKKARRRVPLEADFVGLEVGHLAQGSSQRYMLCQSRHT